MANDGSGGFREWINSGAGRWVAGIGGLALIGAAMWVLIGRGGDLDEKRAAIRAKGRKIIYICTSRQCGSTGKMHVEFDEPYPATCPKCQGKSSVPGFKCTQCRKVFVKTESMVFRCPHCKKLYERMPGSLLRPPEAAKSTGPR